MEIVFENVSYKENINTPLETVHLDNINIKIKDNSITAVLGSSKSGKSFIGSLINATVKPTSGKVKIGEFINDKGYIKNVNKLRINIGYVSMNPNYMFNKTVRKELEFGLKNFNYRNKDKARILDALKLVGLGENYLDRLVVDLTLSEKQKVSLASTLIYNPKVIILDEITFCLNNKEKEDLKNLIKLLKTKYDKTIILLTHDSDFVYGLCDEYYIMSESKVVSNGDKSLLESELITKYNIKVPEIVKFINESNNMGAGLSYTFNILDLIKEVYRNAK